MLNVILLNS